MQQPYHSHSLDHLGLVAGMFDELGIGDVIDRATQQNPATRIVTVGNAVKAMVCNGLGFVNQQLSLVPRFFHKKPPSRLLAPSIDAQHLNDDTLLDRLIATTAMPSRAGRATLGCLMHSSTTSKEP